MRNWKYINLLLPPTSYKAKINLPKSNISFFFFQRRFREATWYICLCCEFLMQQKSQKLNQLASASRQHKSYKVKLNIKEQLAPSNCFYEVLLNQEIWSEAPAKLDTTSLSLFFLARCYENGIKVPNKSLWSIKDPKPIRWYSSRSSRQTKFWEKYIYVE